MEKTERSLPLSPALPPLLDRLVKHGVRPVIVGGYVRDALLGSSGTDIDIECFGIASLDELQPLLAPFGSVNAVGKSFGVLKLSMENLHLDFSLPRTETKTAPGHRGFHVRTFSEFDFKTAASRRDFTINALGYDPIANILLDPFGGIADLHARRLRCVDPRTFVEDPLRLFRAVQFAARFSLTADKRLVTLAHKMVSDGLLRELPKERIFEELAKLLLKAHRPSVGWRLMDTMHMTAVFPELHRLKQVPQDPLSHPERDVWEHTLLALDAMVPLLEGDKKARLALMLGILCHDIGKPDVTRLDSGKVTAPGHADAGITPANALLSRITADKTLIGKVLKYVRYHGEVKRLFKTGASDADILRLAAKIELHALHKIASADHFGRRNPPKVFEAGSWFYSRAAALGVLHAPRRAIVTGTMLLSQGLSPSKRFKTVLEEAYNAQLEGNFSDEKGAKLWLENYLKKFPG